MLATHPLTVFIALDELTTLMLVQEEYKGLLESLEKSELERQQVETNIIHYTVCFSLQSCAGD